MKVLSRKVALKGKGHAWPSSTNLLWGSCWARTRTWGSSLVGPLWHSCLLPAALCIEWVEGSVVRQDMPAVTRTGVSVSRAWGPFPSAGPVTHLCHNLIAIKAIPCSCPLSSPLEPRVIRFGLLTQLFNRVLAFKIILFRHCCSRLLFGKYKLC